MVAVTKVMLVNLCLPGNAPFVELTCSGRWWVGGAHCSGMRWGMTSLLRLRCGRVGGG